MRKLFFLVVLVLTYSLGYAQLPTDLSKVKVSELSDEQVLDILKEGESRGLTVAQAEQMALGLGLPANEAAAFKKRIENIGKEKEKLDLERTIIEPEEKRMLKPSSTVPRIEVKREILEMDSSKLNFYGRSIYRGGNLDMLGQATEIKAPDDYVLGAGDELVVSIYGNSYANEVIKIDGTGAARVRGMGTLYLTGLTFEAARKLIRAKFGQYYDLNNNQFEITLLFSRVISVNVVGEVFNPGTYEFSALNSVFNTLLATGGPSDAGSLRKIEVIRAGKVVYKFDTYLYLAGEGSLKPFSLEDQDYIVVKPIGRVIELGGAVQRPGNFELLPGEGLKELFKWAGGLTSNAYTASIQRVTYANGARETREYSLDGGELPTEELLNGDKVFVRTMPNDVRNAIEVDGDVNQPGTFTHQPGMRVDVLIARAGGLSPTTFGQRAFLSRRLKDGRREIFQLSLDEIISNPSSPANIELEVDDKLLVISKTEFLDEVDVRIIGAVRRPGTVSYQRNLTLADVLLQTGGLKPEADPKRIEVVRLALFDEKGGSDGARAINISLELNEGVLQGENEAFVLMPYDRVYVRTLADFMEPSSIILEGEFQYPGTYAILSREETIYDVIERAGGLKPYAFVKAAKFYRVTAPGGQVLVNLDGLLKSKNSRFNYALLDGDKITVPEYIPYVSLQGPGIQHLQTLGLDAVNAPYKAGLRANRYVKMYGDGFSNRANKRRLFVIEANDRVSRTRNILGIKIYPKVGPGSTVYVMEKQLKKKAAEPATPVDWNRAIENATVKLTGLATLIILLRQL